MTLSLHQYRTLEGAGRGWIERQVFVCIKLVFSSSGTVSNEVSSKLVKLANGL